MRRLERRFRPNTTRKVATSELNRAQYGQNSISIEDSGDNMSVESIRFSETTQAQGKELMTDPCKAGVFCC